MGTRDLKWDPNGYRLGTLGTQHRLQRTEGKGLTEIKKVTDKWLRAQLNKIREKETVITHHGVMIRITTTGKITFAMRYRINGTRVKLSLGAYPALSLGEAVVDKTDAMRLVGQGIDPSIEKKKKSLSYSGEKSFRKLFEYWSKVVYTAGRANDLRRIRAIGNHILPNLGALPVGHITYAMMAKLLREKASRVPAQTKDMITVLKQFWRWLAEEGHIDGTPFFEAIDAAKLGAKSGENTRVLDAEEIRLFWAASARPRLTHRNAAVGQICLLTGCRGHEFQMTGEKNYDRETGVWTIVDHKTKTKVRKPIVRPIGPYARVLMEQSLDQVGKGDRLWPKQDELANGSGNACLTYICIRHEHYIKNKLGKSIPSFGLHDLRRTCRTIMAGLAGYNFIHPESPRIALGHKLQGIDSVYDQWEYEDFLRSAYEVYEKAIMFILASECISLKDAIREFAVQHKAKLREQPQTVVSITDRAYKTA